jgi:hypothetical protein
MTIPGNRPGNRSSSERIRRAVRALKKMTVAERIQLLVEAELMTQEEADQAKQRLAAPQQVDSIEPSPPQASGASR